MSSTKPRAQFAALPFIVTANGRVRVMLVTSRSGRRWVIPKGSPIPELLPAEVAAREAYEEAGLVGQLIARRPVGRFRYAKRGETFDVVVFLMHVERQLDQWPERGLRRTIWFDPSDAAMLVRAPELAAILTRIAGGLGQVLDDALNGPAVTLAPPPARRSRKAIAKLVPLATTKRVWPYTASFSEI